MGGDLSPERLTAAYAQGIFPWYDADSPILWWSPDPRPVIVPSRVHVPARLARTLRQGRFALTLDADFAAVIRACAETPRKREKGTWLVPDMIAAYETLHKAGVAHSAEAWLDGRLVGGLYGVALGKAFFGESMFHVERDASKAAFVALAGFLAEKGFHFIDCQQTTGHIMRFGAEELPRKAFLRLLKKAAAEPPVAGKWALSGQTVQPSVLA